MSLNRLLLAATCSACALMTGASRAADVLTLNSGVSLEGQVLDSDNVSVVIDTGSKKVSLKQTEIKETKLDLEARAELKRRRDALKTEDADGHYQLSQWLQTQHFYGFAKEELEATITIQPMHEKARSALGYTYKDGQWVTSAGTDLVIKAAEPKTEVKTAAKPEATQAQPPADTPENAALRKFFLERAAYYKDVAEACRTLAPSSATTEKDKQAAIAVLKKDSTRATEAVLMSMDCRKTYEPAVRMGALKALEILKTVHPTVSTYLAMEAVGDPDKDVRAAAVSLIKARRDDTAKAGMLRYLMSDFDQSGKVIDTNLRDYSVEALHALGENKRIYEGLLSYVTVEARVANVSLANLQTRQIDTFQPINGLNGGFINLSLPIQLPELSIEGVKTTVVCPAVFALREVTGQDFGNDVNKWQRWINKQQ